MWILEKDSDTKLSYVYYPTLLYLIALQSVILLKEERPEFHFHYF